MRSVEDLNVITDLKCNELLNVNWKFNNSFLKDKNYLTLITDSYPIISRKYANIVDKRLTWELIKMEIRSITISFAARKAKEFHKQESDLQKRLDEID